MSDIISSKWLLIILICIGVTINVCSQTNYSSTQNPYYWRNKLPHPGYWQQDVDYEIKARLDERQEIIEGSETIIYTNNSPDTLYDLFFNLYQNAFLEQSYLTDLQRANGQKIVFGKWEKANKGNEIIKISVNGIVLKPEIDGTVMRVMLDQPMLPGQKIKIELEFKTYYSLGGNTRRRMKSFVYQKRKHFNGAHWYPRLAVYDRKFKWCTDQHLNREFYGDFGTYRVWLDFPADYVVEATGVLQNRSQVLPDSLRQKLDLRNYIHLKWDTAVTFFQKIDSGARKTWHYIAENVHDFAWVAGPHYRIHDSTANGYQVVALVLEPHCSGWTTAIDFTRRVIDVYSREIGPYAYPKMVVADCQDGMEYPMLTMDGGSEPGYRKLLAHEVGHNWFYGMVNNNETYRAMLDEGFTQFLTVLALEAIDGKYLKQTKGKNKLLNRIYEPTCSREANVYNGYIYDAMHHDDPTLNTHSDGFKGALGQGGGYGHVYTKTATMLYNLQYTLGDSLFRLALQNYFDRWSFCHPYIEDFRQSIIDYTRVDLNWFFDQWIETSKHIDYKIYNPKLIDSNYRYQIKLRRKGDMQMPIDLTLYGQSGRLYNFYIPNTWWQKPTTSQPLPRWIGWDSKLKQTYTAEVSIGEPLKMATIDTTRRLADINELNNSTKIPIKWRFDHQMGYVVDRHSYNLNWRPDIWFNNVDGLKLGLHIDGDYMRSFHRIEADVWGNTSLGRSLIREVPEHSGFFEPISLRLSYSSATPKWSRESAIHTHLRWLDGVWLARAGFTKWFGDRIRGHLTFKSFGYTQTFSQHYRYQPSSAGTDGHNTSISIGTDYYNQTGKWYHQNRLLLRTSILSSTSYSYIENIYNSMSAIGPLIVRSRLYGRLGFESTNLSGSQSASRLSAGGANLEEMLENEFIRSVFLIPRTMYDESTLVHSAANLHYGGGLNLRGYAMRVLVSHNAEVHALSNNSGFGANAEIQFHHLSPLKWRKLQSMIGLETYLFGDIGRIGQTSLSSGQFGFKGSPWLADAGVGVALNIKNWRQFRKINPLYFRLDMPLYLSHPNATDMQQHWAFRWLIGVGRMF